MRTWAPKPKKKQIPHAQRTRVRNDSVVGLGNSASGGAGVGGGEFGEKKFEDGAGLGPARAFEATVGDLQGFEAGEKARLGNFAGAVEGEFGLIGAHAKGTGGLPGLRDATDFARFHHLAVHPGERAENLKRLFAFAKNAVEKFKRALWLTRGN